MHLPMYLYGQINSTNVFTDTLTVCTHTPRIPTIYTRAIYHVISQNH